jgi:Cyclin D1 binding domain
MPINDRSRRGTFSNLMLARAVEERPNMALWPPKIIPAKHRVRNASQGNFKDPGHEPQKRSEVSDQTFRIRRWVQMSGQQIEGLAPVGVRLAEEVSTYSTLDPALYTPTADKPYRGIWVGDYAGHGCEFLLIHQPDDEIPFDESSVVQREDETPDEYLMRKREERIYRGRLEAIKLTGDPNVPRGEYTFIADDIGKDGFVRVADETKFKGARIVRSRGHVAERLFQNGKLPFLRIVDTSDEDTKTSNRCIY